MPTQVTRYEIRSVFRAPLAFAYDWCTDYSPKDRQLEGETGTRKILRRTGRTVVYEDLDDTVDGWMWSRFTVTLLPPDRWRAEALGNYRTWDLEYSLRALPDGRTELTLRGDRRPVGLGERNPSKSGLERDLRVMWGHLGRNLERDYRASRGTRRKGTPGG